MGSSVEVVRTEVKAKVEDHEREKTAPGFAVRVVWYAIAVLSLAGWLRLWLSVVNWYWLANVAGVFPGPFYLAVTGALWGLVGLATLLWVLLRRCRRVLVTFSAILFFALTYWLDRLFFAQVGGVGENVTFAVGITLLGLLYCCWALLPLPKLRARFHKQNGEK